MAGVCSASGTWRGRVTARHEEGAARNHRARQEERAEGSGQCDGEAGWRGPRRGAGDAGCFLPLSLKAQQPRRERAGVLWEACTGTAPSSFQHGPWPQPTASPGPHPSSPSGQNRGSLSVQGRALCITFSALGITARPSASNPGCAAFHGGRGHGPFSSECLVVTGDWSVCPKREMLDEIRFEFLLWLLA